MVRDCHVSRNIKISNEQKKFKRDNEAKQKERTLPGQS